MNSPNTAPRVVAYRSIRINIPTLLPSNFAVDINTAMEKIIQGGEAKHWIIFRKTGMKVIEAKVSNFTYKSISQNGVKFAELED